MIGFIERESIVIWLYSTKHLGKLRRHGYIHYVSRRMKYAVMYVNKDEVDSVMKALKSYFFVREVEKSYWNDIDMTFEHAIDPVNESEFDDDLIVHEQNTSFFEDIAHSLSQKQSDSSKKELL